MGCCSRRHWQDLGYFIVYVTGRPDMQKQRVVAWLAQHNFPHGIVSFCDGLVHDPLRHKANFLRSLVHDVGISAKGCWTMLACVNVTVPFGQSNNIHFTNNLYSFYSMFLNPASRCR